MYDSQTIVLVHLTILLSKFTLISIKTQFECQTHMSGVQTFTTLLSSITQHLNPDKKVKTLDDSKFQGNNF